MATVIDTLENHLREELPQVIYESLADVLPIVNRMERTTKGVRRSEEIGRDWEVIHLFGTGVAGLLQVANPGGQDVLASTVVSKQVNALTPGTSGVIFPSGRDSPHTATLKRVLGLHLQTGNFSIPVTWMQAEELSALQAEQIARDIKAVGYLRALVEAASFFGYSGTDSTGSYTVRPLGRIQVTGSPGSSVVQVDSSYASSNSGTFLKVKIDETYGRIHNFRVGMAIDFVANGTYGPELGTATDGSDVLNYNGSNVRIRCIISSVDYINKYIYVATYLTSDGSAPDFTGGWAANPGLALTGGQWIFLENTTTYVGTRPNLLSWGLEDWIKSSGTILGGASTAECLDLNIYHQFASLVVNVAGPLTDTVMNNYIGAFMDAYADEVPDTLITTRGVLLKYLENAQLYNNRQVYERTGKSLAVRGGWSTIEYEFGGRKFNLEISPFCMKGTLYGVKLGGNLMTYVPPKIGGSDARVGGEVSFLAPLGESRNIFLITRYAPANGGGVRPEPLVEAPFFQYKLVCPVNPRSVKLYGLTENL